MTTEVSVRASQVKLHLERATTRVEEEDGHLLMIDVSERCIAARLAMYLREYFPAYDVDVEYNRHGKDKKQLYELVYHHGVHRDRDDEGQTVLPDVIVHRRGVDESNLLIIEMKKSENRVGLEKDRRRIRAFQRELGYKFGALVICQTGEQSEISVECCAQRPD